MKILAVDGNSIINRAFYGVPALSNSEGIPTNAVYGFFNTLTKLTSDLSPDLTVVCFDLKEKTFRHKMYDGYKAQRKPMPDDLAAQLPLIKEALGFMGIPSLSAPGYEADDLLGTIAELSTGRGDECIIVTGDKDSLQFIDHGATVCLVKTRMGRTETFMMDREAFMAEYSGLTPGTLVDLKALMGDKSDNIPGVPGIGEKGAMDLLLKFGTLEGVYENIGSDDISASVRKKLTEGRDLAFLSYKLALGCVEAPVELDKIKMSEPDNGSLFGLFSKLELRTLIKRLGLESHPAKAFEMPPSAEVTQSAAEGCVCGSVPFYRCGDRAAVLCDNKIMSFKIDDAGKLFKALAASGFWAFDSKPVIREMMDAGIPETAPDFDCGVAAYLLEPNGGKTDMAYCAEKYLGFSLGEPEDVSLGCAVTAALRPVLEEKLDELGMTGLYRDIELPLIPVLASMEHAGMMLDRKKLTAYGEELSVRIGEVEKDVFAEAGEEFNIGSPKQLGVILYEKLGLKPVKKTKTGYSTNADALDKLRGKHPIVGDILEWRKLTKLRSTYVEGLLDACGDDMRVHTTFNQTITATGRLSSTDPNMQNIPVRREEGAEIRRFFVASPGMTLIDADYGQIELRVLAHVSNDEAMIGAFKNGEDIHTMTASKVFGVPADEVTPFMRSSAKAVNFGIVYGISAFSLSEDIHVFVNEAQNYIETYFERFSGVKDYLDRIKDEAKRQGWVKTEFGRRRQIPEISSSNFNVRSFGERVAMNTPIQGTAADIMKIAMIKAYHALRKECPGARLLLQVHDELIVEAPSEQAERAAAVLKEAMESAYPMKAPLICDIGKGDSWLDAKG